jgi:hypothetical protein
VGAGLTPPFVGILQKRAGFNPAPTGASCHDFDRCNNSETVSKLPGYYHLVPVGQLDQKVKFGAYALFPPFNKEGLEGIFLQT